MSRIIWKIVLWHSKKCMILNNNVIKVFILKNVLLVYLGSHVKPFEDTDLNYNCC